MLNLRSNHMLQVDHWHPHKLVQMLEVVQLCPALGHDPVDNVHCSSQTASGACVSCDVTCQQQPSSPSSAKA